MVPPPGNGASQPSSAKSYGDCKFRMPNGFVKNCGETMSRVQETAFFLKDALKIYSGEVLRFYLIGVHYRNDFNFNEIDLLSAKKRLDKPLQIEKEQFTLQKLGGLMRILKNSLINAMSDDLNISKALSIIDEVVKKY